jgi:membrane-associated phospholipid phosphatase
MLTAWSLQYDALSRKEFTRGVWETDLVDFGDTYGNGGQLTAMGAGLWSIGTIAGDTMLRHTGQLVLAGMLLDGACVTALKLATQRERPDGSDRRSFPSGHTSGAWTVSTILARRHGMAVGIPAYALASMTAVARMEDRRHYLSDVVAGAAIGLVIGRVVTRDPADGGMPMSARFDGRKAAIGIAF